MNGSDLPLDTECLLASYDYVIVGAASAGSVLTARLSEDPRRCFFWFRKWPCRLWHFRCGTDLTTWSYKMTPQRDVFAKGPMTVADANQNFSSELLDAFLKAGVSLGYEVGKVNGEQPTGTFMHNQANVENGRRQSEFDAYIRPVIGARNNLETEPWEFNCSWNRNLRIWSTSTPVEVILAACSVSKPKILMLSGIGRRNNLEYLHIPVVVDLPVGDNLQDHVLFPVLQFTVNVPVSIRVDDAKSVTEILKYAVLKRGILSHPIDIMGHAFFKSTNQRADDIRPYRKLVLSGVMMGGSEEGTRQYSVIVNQDLELRHHVFGGYEGRHGFQLYPVMLHLGSIGTIRLAYSDPGDDPLIDPAYLYREKDIAMMVEGIRLADLHSEPDGEQNHLKLIVASKGEVVWVRPVTYTVTCKHEFRGNAWLCPLTFGSWVYNTGLLDIHGEKRKIDVNDDHFLSSDHFTLLGHEGKREVVKDKCCDGPFTTMNYLIKLRNKIGPALLGRK
ncbi:hypothetical protein LSH36_59g00010 [Paralvinella palmiformis]|uniref:Glucose-methanol-choline oxidoreductase N-terminal domain-containing protein n=1 Tax=Paralvinella palmiformis TaxID=53620 RepID=A0AAD9NEY7_9ANNE|nr:hypothetical protein LSH36_59g00010 [Paralvinella palmiformis]